RSGCGRSASILSISCARAGVSGNQSSAARKPRKPRPFLVSVAAIVIGNPQASDTVEKAEPKQITANKRGPSAQGRLDLARFLAFRRELSGGGRRVTLDLGIRVGEVGDRIVL